MLMHDHWPFNHMSLLLGKTSNAYWICLFNHLIYIELQIARPAAAGDLNRNQRIDLTTVNNWPYLSNNFIYWYLNFISATPAVFVCLPACLHACSQTRLPACWTCMFILAVLHEHEHKHCMHHIAYMQLVCGL